MRRYIFLCGAVLIWVLLASPTPLRALRPTTAGFSPVPIPAGLVPVSPLHQADLDRDGVQEELILESGHLSIISAGNAVWESPDGWQVNQAEVTDLDHDGLPEAALLVWRPFQPWPVDRWLPHGGRISDFQDKFGNSCHIILVGWLGNRWGEVWAGSALAEPVRSFAAADLDGDGIQDLVTLEGSYADDRPLEAFPLEPLPGNMIKVWNWNGFGFSVVYSYAGDFHTIALVRTVSGRRLVLAP